MSESASQDGAARARRHTTRYRGITYRQRADGSRTYFVYWQANHLKAGSTEAEAVALQSNLKARKARGERVVLASKRTVAEVAEEWFAAEQGGWRQEYRSEQRRMLDKHIIPMFGDDRIASIGPVEIIGYDKKLRARGLSASGTANVLKPLRGLCEHAVLAGDIAVSPFTQIPKGKLSSCNTRREHHTWTTEEVDRFIAAAYAHDERKDARRSYGLQVEVMIRLGLRIAEASGLHFSDIDFTQKTVRVRRQWTKHNRLAEYTKSQAGRRDIPVTDELLAKLAFRQSFLGLGDGDFVFAEAPGGNPSSHSNFRRRGWNPVVTNTGLKLEDGVKVTCHDARHATASQLADLGLDEEDGAALLGHTSGRVTRGIYVHSWNKEQREARIRDAMERAAKGEAR